MMGRGEGHGKGHSEGEWGARRSKKVGRMEF